MNDTYDYDFIVIGSGFGGSVSAMRLAEKGYKVAVLEQGRRFETQELPKSNWDIRNYMWMPLVRCFGIFRMTLLSHVFVLSGTGVGGGSLVYGNTLYIPPDEFFSQDNWPSGINWKESLLPHYWMAQYMLGVTENQYEGKADALLKEVAVELSCEETYKRTQIGVYLGQPGKEMNDPYFGGAGPSRKGCTLCGGCFIGCRDNAKNTLDKNYLYFARKMGVEIFPMRTVSFLQSRNDGGYDVHHQKTGGIVNRDKKIWSARKVVLSAGVLGTVKLLYDSKQRGGLPLVSQQLGQRVRTNSEAILNVRSRTSGVDYSKGIAITSSIYPDKHTHIEAFRYKRGSDALSLISTLMTDGGNDRSRTLKWLTNIVKNPLDFLRSLWPVGWAKKSIMLLVMQSVENQISLIPRRSILRFGQTSLDSAKSSNASIPTYIPIGHRAARSIAKKVDGIPQSALPEVLFDVPTTAHILGGAAIGESPSHGVIDCTHQVFDYPGLYVCDGSTLPANLGVNPSLTITAMTERAMSYIPVKEGEILSYAIDPTWTEEKVEFRKNEFLKKSKTFINAIKDDNGERLP